MSGQTTPGSRACTQPLNLHLTFIPQTSYVTCKYPLLFLQTPLPHCVCPLLFEQAPLLRSLVSFGLLPLYTPSESF